jgi:hypothetical protein
MVHVVPGPPGRKAAAARVRAVSGSAVGYAAAAAVCIALGSALQHQAAGGHDHRGGIGLLRRLARSRRWMTGLAAAGAGTLMHAAALRGGALAVVEPVLVMNVALALGQRPGGHRFVAVLPQDLREGLVQGQPASFCSGATPRAASASATRAASGASARASASTAW